MAMIKCAECGKDISDKAAACIGCGAPIAVTANRIGDANGDGKFDFDDLKAAFGKLKDKTTTAVEGAISMGKEVLKTKSEKDAETIAQLDAEFGNQEISEPTEPQIMPATPVEKTKTCNSCGIEKPAEDFLHKHIYTNTCQHCRLLGASTVKPPKQDINRDKFKAALESTIDLKFAEVMKSRPDTDKYLTYVDAQILATSVRNIFKSALSFTPPQVDAACRLSEAILAPSAQEKQNLIKAAIGLSGGTAGIGMVIGGVATALGWGASAAASVTAFFVGTSMAGPVGWMIAGVSLAAIAGYFATTSNKQTDTERFINVLKNASAKAVDAIWEQYGDELSKAVGNSSSAS
jgi:hypothetical protein